MPTYTTVELEQGTREWLEWRLNGIGASDAPTVMGENPWKPPEVLFMEKCRATLDTEQNPAMRRGTELEPEARRRYAARTGREVQPACLQSLEHEWLRASVDGITPCRRAVVEIKCGESVYRKTAARNRAPDYYYGQLQHILAVTGLNEIDFWCYLPLKPELLVTVERDDDYIQRLLRVEQKFWERLRGTRGAP
jgi:putative phage-type endonuclease